jgi:hypothetical protein
MEQITYLANDSEGQLGATAWLERHALMFSVERLDYNRVRFNYQPETRFDLTDLPPLSYLSWSESPLYRG